MNIPALEPSFYIRLKASTVTDKNLQYNSEGHAEHAFDFERHSRDLYIALRLLSLLRSSTNQVGLDLGVIKKWHISALFQKKKERNWFLDPLLSLTFPLSRNEK